jgi:peptide/nickel transport system ATP-binding protein
LRADDVAPPGALPRVELPSTTSGDPLIEVDGLIAEHRSSHEVVLAADAVTFGVRRGRCVALVGESGSGKTTIARCIVGLHERAGGSILFDGQPLAALARRRTREQRRRIQIVFQNPYESLNPRQPAGEAVAWPARALRGLSRDGAMRAATEVLDRVRLPARIGSRYPGELSGGERQRVAIARALAAQPDLLVCDEITSALDVSVQAAVLGLLRELQLELGLTLLFITHDLGVVASVADEVLVLERGVVHERGSVGAVLGAPQQQYTQQLIGAAPSLAVTQPDVTSTAAPPAQDPS